MTPRISNLREGYWGQANATNEPENASPTPHHHHHHPRPPTTKGRRGRPMQPRTPRVASQISNHMNGRREVNATNEPEHGPQRSPTKGNGRRQANAPSEPENRPQDLRACCLLTLCFYQGGSPHCDEPVHRQHAMTEPQPLPFRS